MKYLLTPIALLLCACAHAAVYDAPQNGDVIGEVRRIQASADDTLSAIARRYDVGYRELTQANPNVDPWLPGDGTEIVLPTQYVLPEGPREGMEMRLYYFPPAESDYAGKVFTYPLGIGREGWATPLGRTRIVRTAAEPTWYPPESIRQEHEEKGDPLPRVVEPGPENPLGEYALYLGMSGYLIHGTNKPAGIGMRVSHGCIRLYPEDIAALYAVAGKGTSVRIVEQPYKLGWHGERLHLEAHPSTADGDARAEIENATRMVEKVIAATKDAPDYPVDWDAAERLAQQSRGVPVAIGPARVTRTAARDTPPTRTQP